MPPGIFVFCSLILQKEKKLLKLLRVAPVILDWEKEILSQRVLQRAKVKRNKIVR